MTQTIIKAATQVARSASMLINRRCGLFPSVYQAQSLFQPTYTQCRPRIHTLLPHIMIRALLEDQATGRKVSKPSMRTKQAVQPLKQGALAGWLACLLVFPALSCPPPVASSGIPHRGSTQQYFAAARKFLQWVCVSLFSIVLMSLGFPIGHEIIVHGISRTSLDVRCGKTRPVWISNGQGGAVIRMNGCMWIWSTLCEGGFVILSWGLPCLFLKLCVCFVSQTNVLAGQSQNPQVELGMLCLVSSSSLCSDATCPVVTDCQSRGTCLCFKHTVLTPLPYVGQYMP
ncbi:hypothetical protein BD289DRAFT_202631 [Coniella lustricola]|uniref:Uncharacterized protein n=1 Tax=Coniella lustricola TaxID=2025994 RepID=A0A2T2ZSG0_9PEZI|nr:hypothetical protein BD289DRAFT_202631 [Coniella lustricola]